MQANSVVLVLIGASFVTLGALAPSPDAVRRVGEPTVKQFGAVGDGETDDTEAIQAAVDVHLAELRFPKGVYRITKTITIDLDRVGPASISADGTATIVMAGPGPAFRFVGTHEGTADPTTVQPSVWQRERTPMVDGIEIVGEHPHACGIEASGTMQLTITRTTVREALHAVHLVKRNRNVIVSNCHLYHNRGIGIFLDRLNLHQINVIGSHVSYNEGGGIVARESEIRNLQIGTCDIEGNMGGADSKPTANILLDSTGESVAEVAIVGCTIQHSHEAPDSANIRIDCKSKPRPFTDELRHGFITIADNVLSDVQVNVELRNARGVTVTGNTFWKGFRHNLFVEGCQNVVLANNVFDRNPRYHYQDGAAARLGIVFRDSADCTITGNHVHDVGEVPAAISLARCRRMNVTGCTILNFGQCGLLFDDVSDSRVSDCLIHDARSREKPAVSINVTGGHGNMIVNNLLGDPFTIDSTKHHVAGNLRTAAD